jgi:hypothetical protein
MRIKHSKDSTNRRLVGYYALSTGSPFCEPHRFECLDALCIGQIISSLRACRVTGTVSRNLGSTTSITRHRIDADIEPLRTIYNNKAL